MYAFRFQYALNFIFVLVFFMIWRSSSWSWLTRDSFHWYALCKWNWKTISIVSIFMLLPLFCYHRYYLNGDDHLHRLNIKQKLFFVALSVFVSVRICVCCIENENEFDYKLRSTNTELKQKEMLDSWNSFSHSFSHFLFLFCILYIIISDLSLLISH